jgi:hypothetical protein
MNKRYLKLLLLRSMRSVGILCKKPVILRPMRIVRTVYPDGYSNDLDSEIHVFVQNKKAAFKNCAFDENSHSCVCGKRSLDQFAREGCGIKNIKSYSYGK